ncbi:flagellar biosynthesis protein FlhB [Pusillimonas sp.]|uniref:flagellar biosynthesis protein FlhB n=1 Tax=Pusillimonas sp. TaxID=3040095 RepID=UPI0037C5135C
MAEDSDLEKTEAATPRRLEKAREEGQVARSRELNTFMLLGCGVAMLWLTGAFLYRSLNGVIRAGLWFDPRIAKDTSVMTATAAQSAFQALTGLLPIFGALVVVAIFSSVALGGLVFSSKALQPKFERLNPLKGVKRMFSAQTLVELLKTLAKAAVIGGIGAAVIWNYREEMVSLMHTTPTEALTAGMRLVALCCGLIVAALILIVGIDAPWQLWSHHKKMRMSRQDVKQEHKESEGDPHVKGRIRQQQRAMARRRMMSEVPAADVVVTNPTHYAVALAYSEQGTGAPRVVAKGSGLIAARIREVALEYKVPLLSAPPLARALHHHVEIGHEIPAALYGAVAQVLAWVYQLRTWQPGHGAAPMRPEDLPVPPDLDPANKRGHEPLAS